MWRTVLYPPRMWSEFVVPLWTDPLCELFPLRTTVYYLAVPGFKTAMG